jgi:hypothetical protein
MGVATTMAGTTKALRVKEGQGQQIGDAAGQPRGIVQLDG